MEPPRNRGRYVVWTAKEGVLSEHASISSALIALWLRHTEVPSEKEAAAIYDCSVLPWRLVSPAEYSFQD